MTLLASEGSLTTWDEPIARAAKVQSLLATSHYGKVGGTTAAGDVRNLSGVGGDFVDILQAEGDLVAVLGDVSGKGVASSLIAAMVLGSLQHHTALIGPRPAEILRAVAASMRGALDRTGSIVTLVIVAVDSRAGVARLVSAGHHPVLRVTDGEVVHEPATCAPLGLDHPGAIERDWAWGRGSALLVASDGVVDQEGPSGSAFGMAGLAGAVASLPAVSASALVVRTLERVERHAAWVPAVDDRAVLAIAA